MSLNPVLLSLLHADNIAPISAARLVIRWSLFTRVYRPALLINSKIALIDANAVSCAICELHKRVCLS